MCPGASRRGIREIEASLGEAAESTAMSGRPTAIDLFCGGGGFSEGLRQAGFDITHAVDIEARACETYRLNHPETEVIEADLLELDPDRLPADVDLVFGSPPCTEFSWAKQGGGGDIEAGMRLVKRFLHLVGELDPEYWIMENVPRLDSYLPETVEFTDIPWSDRTDSMSLTKVVLDADEYGTPQRRSRLFSGHLPVPEPTGEAVPTFGEIAGHLPPATRSPPADTTVTDPSYDLTISADELTDHHYVSHLTHREAEEIRVRKEDHSFYGRMAFPDDPTVPSRTVLATNRRVARETLVMEAPESVTPDGLSRYRKPTIREIACIQGFPLTYQFTGGSQAQKWRRVGDAVPPPLARALGHALRADMGLSIPETPLLRTDTPHPETDLNDRDTSWKGRRRLSISRTFRHHVPYDDKRRFRVDLETDTDGGPPHPLTDAVETDWHHPVRFEVKLYRGYSTDVVSRVFDLETTIEHVDRLLAARPALEPVVEDCVRGLLERLGPQVPDATTLQAIRSRRAERDEPLEYELLREISSFEDDDREGVVDTALPRRAAADHEPLSCPALFDGTELPVRVLLKLLAANHLATRLNRCGAWLRAGESFHVPEDIEGQPDETTVAAVPCRRERCVEDELRERYLRGTALPETERAPAQPDQGTGP